jgi:ATP-dependent DNA helicase RecQ
MDTAILKAASEVGYSPLKEHQKACIESFMNGNDVFVVLPTGYGKSACYACVPRAIDLYQNRKDEDSSIIIVVSPLTSLMKDQVENFKMRNISAEYIDQDSPAATKHNARDGKYSILFMSPELLVSSWRNLFSSHEKRLVGLIVDEAHCVVKW